MARAAEPLWIKLTADPSFQSALSKWEKNRTAGVASHQALVSSLPNAFAHILGTQGKSVYERTRHIDLGRAACARQLVVPAFHRPDIVRIIMRLSASMGDCRTPVWSARRIVICSLFLLWSDRPDPLGPIRLVHDRGEL